MTISKVKLQNTSRLIAGVFLSLIIACGCVFYATPQLPKAHSETKKSAVVIKSAKNVAYCKIDAFDNICDLDTAAKKIDTNSTAKGKLTLTEDGDAYILTLDNVNAEGLILSADDPITLKGGDNQTQKIGSIIETESSASIIFEQGNYEISNANGPAINAAGRLVFRKGVNTKVTGANGVIRSFGQLLTDEDVTIDASITDDGIGTMISANGIETNAGTHITINNNQMNSNQNITGIATILGGNINFKQTDLDINTPLAINTLSGMFGAGNVFIHGGKTTISAFSAGIITANLTTFDNADINITAEYEADLPTYAIGAVGNIDFNNTALDTKSTYGLASNGDISINDGSQINIQAKILGLSVVNDFSITDTSSININPFEAVDETDPSDITLAAFIGNKAEFSLLDEPDVIARFSGRYNAGLSVADSPELAPLKGGGAILCGGNPITYNPIILAGGVQDSEMQFYKFNSEKNAIEVTDKAPNTCDLDISDTTLLAPTAMQSATTEEGFSRIDSSANETELTFSTVEIVPVQVNFLVKSFIKYPTIFVSICLLILLLLGLIIFLVVYRITHRRALFIANPQNDMMDDGPLAIKGATEKLALIERYLAKYHKKYHKIFITRQIHPEDSAHFEKWPKHDVEGTAGADLAGNLTNLYNEYNIDFITTGQTDDGYNILEGTLEFNANSTTPKLATKSKSQSGITTGKLPETVLSTLKLHKIRYVYLTGYTLDYTILKSAIEFSKALKKNHVVLLRNLIVPIANDVKRIYEKLAEKGVILK